MQHRRLRRLHSVPEAPPRRGEAAQADPGLKAPPGFQSVDCEKGHNNAFNLNLVLSELVPLRRGPPRAPHQRDDDWPRRRLPG